MNVGIVTTWFERGASYVSKGFADEISQENNVFIYARGGEKYAKGDENWDSYNVTWNNFLNSFVPTDICKKQFENWIVSNKINVIIFNEQQFWLPVLWAKSLGIKTVSYIDYYTKENLKYFEIFDQLWCNTKRHFEAFKWHDGAKYIKWGTDVNTYLPSERYSAQPIFFHSAGMNPYRKGTDIFIEALHKMSKNSDIKGVIHTQKNISEAFPEKEKKITDLIKSKQLKIINRTIHAPGLYKDYDVYVYPSRLDGIGLTICEALSCGLPVIATDNPPMNEFIDKKYSKLIDIKGFVTRSDNYFWDMCEPCESSLLKQMSYFYHNWNNLKNVKNFIRNYAEENLNAKRNFTIINDHLEDIEMKDISKKIKKEIIRHDSSNIILHRIGFPQRILKAILKKIKQALI